MKSVIVADLHVNASHYGEMNRAGLSWRSHDFRKVFSHVVNQTIKHIEPELFFILGDIFEHPYPDNDSRHFFTKQIRKLADANIETHVLIGNHDANMQGHALLEMEASKIPKNHIYYERPGVLKRDNTIFLLFPHTPEVENKSVTMRRRLLDYVEKSRKIVKKAQEEGKTIVFMGHFGVFGAMMNDGVVDIKPESVMLDDLSTIGSQIILLGDYHRHQRLKVETSEAYYIGSLERTSISDLESDKGFMVYDDGGGEGKIKFISCNEVVRPMFNVEGGLNLPDKAEALGQDAKDAIIRLSFVGTKNDLDVVGPKIIDIKTRLEKKFQAKHVYTKMRCRDPEQETAALAVLKELEEIGDVIEEKDVENMVRINIEKASFQKEEKQAIIALAVDIIGTVKKNRKIS